MANFKRRTRYTNGTVTEDRNSTRFLVLRPPLNLNPAEDDTFVTVTDEYTNRPDLLSYVAYGDEKLWWVICEFNNIRDPFFGFKPGQILRIPGLDRVLQAINKLNRV